MIRTTREQAAAVIERWTLHLADTAHEAFPIERFPPLPETDWADIERALNALGVSPDRLYADIARAVLEQFVKAGRQGLDGVTP